MRALITRPRDDAERVAAPLRDRGVEIFLDPLLTIRFNRPSARFPWQRDPLAQSLKKAQALIFSSSNGVRAFAAANKDRSKRVFAVGDTTADLARDVGFSNIENAKGDVNSLAALIRRLADPAKGPLLHICGNKVAGDLPGLLAPSGFTVIRHQLYEARPATVLLRSTLDGFKEDALDTVFLFSPRTAEIFSQLIRAADLTDNMRRVVAYALSPAIARALGDLPLQAVRVSAEPTQESLIALFDSDCGVGIPLSAVPHTVPLPGEDHIQGLAFDFQTPDTKEQAPVTEPKSSGSAVADTPAPAPETSISARPVWDTPAANRPAPSGPGASSTISSSSGTTSSPSGTTSSSSGTTSSSSGTMPTPPWPGTGPTAAPSAAQPAAGAASFANPANGGTTGQAPPPPPPPKGSVPPTKRPAPPVRPAGQAPTKRGCMGCFVPLMLLLLVIFALPGSYAFWRNQIPAEYRVNLPPLPNDPLMEETNRLNKSIDLLRREGIDANKRIVKLDTDLAAVRKIAEENQIVVNLDEPLNTLAAAFLNRRLDQFQNRLELLVGSTVTPANVLSLSDRVTEVERLARQTQVRRVSALVLLASVSQIRESMDNGTPFIDQVRTMAAISEGDPKFRERLIPLEGIASKGVMPRPVLRASFAEAATAVTRAVALSENDGWLDRTVGSIKSVVMVRRTDLDSNQPEPLTLLARAEMLVNQNDLAGAVMALEALSGKPLEAATPWLDAVRARLIAESSLSDLTSLALAEVSASRALQPSAPDVESPKEQAPTQQQGGTRR